MKEIIATEAIYSPLGFQKAVRFHYADGSSSEPIAYGKERGSSKHTKVEHAPLSKNKAAKKG